MALLLVSLELALINCDHDLHDFTRWIAMLPSVLLPLALVLIAA